MISIKFESAQSGNLTRNEFIIHHSLRCGIHRRAILPEIATTLPRSFDRQGAPSAMAALQA
jgi:hypothetical protein